MIIAHNLSSANAGRRYNVNTAKRDKSLRNLSTGYRVNSAADDAAGLSISEKMRSQVRGLSRSAQNIQDGISYVQVADGALNEVNDILLRIRELAVQSANDTNTVDDRAAINEEVDALKSEMQRIFTQTEFNTIKIWDDRGKKLGIDHIIPGESHTVDTVKINGKSIRSTLNNTNKEAAPLNSPKILADTNGIRARWTGYNGVTYTSDYMEWGEKTGGTHTFKLSDHMDYTAFPETKGIDFQFSYTADSHASVDELITALNNYSMNSSISNSASTENSGLVSGDGISTSIILNYTALLAAGVDVTIKDDAVIEAISGGNNIVVNPVTGSSSDDFKFAFDMPGIGRVSTKVSSASYSCSDRSADTEGLWWYTYTYSDGRTTKLGRSQSISPPKASLDAILYAITNTDGKNVLTDGHNAGGSFSIQFSLEADSPFTTKSGATTKNVGTLSMSISLKPGDTPALLTSRLSHLTGVDAYSVANPTTRIYNSDSTLKYKTTYSDPDTPVYAYEQDLDRHLRIQAGANTAQIVDVNYEALRLQNLGLADTQVDTWEHAEAAIMEVDYAQQIVTAQRALFGAYQNRFEHAYAANLNTEENLQAAESRIRDVDMADEVVQLSRHNILMQVGEAMISQANHSQESVISLINPR